MARIRISIGELGDAIEHLVELLLSRRRARTSQRLHRAKSCWQGKRRQGDVRLAVQVEGRLKFQALLSNAVLEGGERDPYSPGLSRGAGRRCDERVQVVIGLRVVPENHRRARPG